VAERNYPKPPEATIAESDGVKFPEAEGWYVLNATEAVWWKVPGYGQSAPLEPRDPNHRFGTYGMNIHVLDPGEPNCRYHAESNQEDFLVLSGECILIAEGEERHLKQWDFVHCPPHTRHVFVGAGDGPCAILMAGARPQPGEEETLDYPVDDEAAVKHGAAAPKQTSSSKEAYADIEEGHFTAYRPGDLAGS
jgi:uncharacterized cupin superfamily protein